MERGCHSAGAHQHGWFKAVTTIDLAPGVRRGPVGIPDRTLGWAALDWTANYLLQPDGPDAGQPWNFTNEQARFILNWYAIDEAGRFIYRRGMLRRMKGWGKDPVGAALACVEFAGPCRFGGWDAKGQPIAVPHAAAWIQIAAVSKDQTRNTMTLFPGMLGPRAIQEHQVDLGKEIIYGHRGQRRIEAVTSSPRSLEGGRPTFTLKNETHHWIASNEGNQMAAVIDRNAAKSRDGSSRVLGISNAHAPGEGSDAEVDWESWNVNPEGFLYDSVEAPDDVDLDNEEELRAALEWCRGDSSWLDVPRLMAEVRDPRTPPNMARRFYLNQLAAGTDRAFDRDKFVTLARPGYRVEDGELITLGFDGAESRDHTVLIGTEVTTGFQWVVGYWEPVPDGSGGLRTPTEEVDAAVSAAFERWNVWRLYGDPFYWGEWLAVWRGRWNRPSEPRVLEWKTTLLQKMAYALLDYRTAMQSGALSHDGDPRFVASIANAYRHTQAFTDDNGERMWTIAKERMDSPLKIDAAIAGCLSWQARTDAIAAGEPVETPKVSVMFL